MIGEKKRQMEEKLKRDIIDTKDIAITHDSWTSINTESYGTVTAHFIDKEWQLKSVVLETRKIEGSHTGEAIAANLKKTQKEWSLPSLLTATTDNAPNEMKAFDHLQWPRFGCCGHRINLAVKKALSIPEMTKMLAKGRKIVTYYHQSSSAMDILKEKQLLLFDTTSTRKLIQNVPTRWNSTLDMLERLLELTSAIISMVNDPKCTKATSEAIKNYSFHFQEQSIIQRTVEVLSPFKKSHNDVLILIQLCKKVIPVFLKLNQSTQKREDDPDILKKLKKILRNEIEKRTQDRDIPLLACLLNPGTKNLQSLKEEDFQRAKLLLEQKAAQVESITVKKEKLDEADEHLYMTKNEEPLPALSTFPEEDTIPIDEATTSEIHDNNNTKNSSQGTKRKMKDWIWKIG